MNHKRQKYCKHNTHHKITGYKPESRNASSSKLWKGTERKNFEVEYAAKIFSRQIL